MSADLEPLFGSAEELFEDAPCGYLTTRLDGSILQVNRTFEVWTGLQREQLLAGCRFQDLLSAGGRIFYETHYSPLLQLQGSVREVALDIVRADKSLLPALTNSVLRQDADGNQVIRTTVFDATDRRRYEQEIKRAGQHQREVALELQRSLLSGILPASSAAMELEFSYSPAEQGTEVGGDWYDAFWVSEDETLGLVIGDVVGRGITAAATMGQLRSAVRALASTGLSPAALLMALDRYSRRHHVGKMTTLVYAELELDTGSLRFACAGHPPPLVAPADAQPYFGWDGRSAPLGIMRPEESRPEAELVVEPGSAVLFYTDGLIESRAQPDRDGLAEMLNTVSNARGASLAQLIARLGHVLPDGGRSDDVCVLAVRRLAADRVT